MIPRRSTIGFTSLVWATIATTLFATSPHLECLCPDGGRKPFCLSLLLGGTSYRTREVKPQDEGDLVKLEPRSGGFYPVMGGPEAGDRVATRAWSIVCVPSC